MKLHIFFLFIFYFALFTIQVATAQSKRELNTRMLQAAKSNQADSVKYWLDKGADINYSDSNGASALNHVIGYFDNELSKYLIDKGAYVNGKNSVLMPPIWTAAYYGNLRCCYLLYKRGADINIKDSKGLSALDYAEGQGYIRVADFLRNPQSYSEEPTCDEYFRISESALANNQIDKALEFAEKAKTAASRELSPTNTQFSTLLNKVAGLYQDQGKFDKAELLYLQALDLDKRILGEKSSEYATSLSNLALLYVDQAKFNQAENLYIKALQITKETLGDKHPDYAITLDNLAVLYNIIGNNKDALTLSLQSLKIRKDVFGEESRDYAYSLNNLGSMLDKLGYSIDAEPLLLRSLQIGKKICGVSSSEYATTLNNLASLYNNLEEYDKSEPLHKESLSILKKLYGSSSQIVAGSLGAIAFMYKNMGDYNKAEPLYIEALNIIKDIFGDFHPEVALLQNNLAMLYLKQSKFDQAEPLFVNTLQINNKFFGERSLEYSTTLLNLALLNQMKGNYQKSEHIYLQVDTIQNNTLPKDNPYKAFTLNNIAYLYDVQRDFNKAELYYKQALQIRRNSLGIKHPLTLGSIENLFLFYKDQKQYSSAFPLFVESSEIHNNKIKSSFTYLSERERTSLWHKEMGVFATYKSFAYDYYSQNPSISTFAYNNELFTKGILVNTSQIVQQSILSSGDTTLIHTWDKMKSIRKRINFLELQPKEKQVNLLELEEEADQLDKVLTQKSQAYRQAQSEQQIKWQDVQAKLKDDEAAIEFSSFSYFHKEWTDSVLYCALVLKKGMEYPVMVPLCEQKQLDSLFVGGNAAPNNLYASRGVIAEYKDQLPNGKKLYHLIWQPLEKELRDVKTVYYSPSGSLHQISFAALPTDTAHYLCDMYNLVQLSSTRQLATATWQTKPQQISSTALFGGIKYDIDNQEIAELQRSLSPTEINNFCRFKPDSTRSSTSFDFLQGTKVEVETISEILKSNRLKTTLYTGLHGNEEAFKALSNQNTSVLHIATHGFFYPDVQQKPERLDDFMSLGEQRFRYVPNPLLRSGLILSGGNRVWKGEEPIAGLEDGILTAQEVSEMNLQNTELVVLSACETGLGDIKGGEGVFGLQRAFKLAGVKTIIMSLWTVDDKATSEMMQLFYSKWLTGTDKRESFRLAQQELKKKYKDPYYWAGFVMMD